MKSVLAALFAAFLPLTAAASDLKPGDHVVLGSEPRPRTVQSAWTDASGAVLVSVTPSPEERALGTLIGDSSRGKVVARSALSEISDSAAFEGRGLESRYARTFRAGQTIGFALTDSNLWPNKLVVLCAVVAETYGNGLIGYRFLKGADRDVHYRTARNAAIMGESAAVVAEHCPQPAAR